MNEETTNLMKRIENGHVSALARAITKIENADEGYLDVVSQIFQKSGKAHIVGITGSPGTGKSTLVDKLAFALEQKGKSVAVLAIDPSSPYSKGAILGDRIRMTKAQSASNVFIRSIASRGKIGGLAKSVRNIVTLLDGYGYDVILIETVGSGQTEIDIMNLAHTTIVVSAPGLGDEVQAQKAGIMEIADLYVVNKADLPFANTTANQIEQMLMEESVINRKQVPVILASSIKEEGIDEIVETIDLRWKNINETEERRQIEQSQIDYKLMESMKDAFASFLESEVIHSSLWDEIANKVYQKEIHHEVAAKQLLSVFFKK